MPRISAPPIQMFIKPNPICIYFGSYDWLLSHTGTCEGVRAQRLKLPLGDLQGVSECWLSLEGLLVKKALDGVSSQLFHDDKGLSEVQQHGEVVILAMSQHMDALGQKYIGRFLKLPDLVPRDDQFYYRER